MLQIMGHQHLHDDEGFEASLWPGGQDINRKAVVMTETSSLGFHHHHHHHHHAASDSSVHAAQPGYDVPSYSG